MDQRTDIYALGLIMYELLTEQPAIAGDSAFDILTRQVSETPPSLKARGVHANDAVEAAISLASLIVMAVFSLVMQQCSARRIGKLIQRVDHAMASE